MYDNLSREGSERQVGKWRQQPSTGLPPLSEEAVQELAQEVAAEQELLAEAEALASTLAAELARCVQEEHLSERICRAAGDANTFGPLAGGNLIFLSGDYTGRDKIVAIGGTEYAAYALTSSGKVWTWGSNYYGEAGNGIMDGTYAFLPRLIMIREPIVEIAAANNGFHMLALGRSGDVYSWGYDRYNNLMNWKSVKEEDYHYINSNMQYIPQDVMPFIRSLLHTQESVTHVYPSNTNGWGGSYFLTSEGRLFYAGIADNGYCPQPGLPIGGTISPPAEITPYIPLRQGEKIVQLILGNDRTLVLTDQQRAYVWGMNYYGALGLGDIGYYICEPTNLATNFYLPSGEYIVDGMMGEQGTLLLTNQANLYFVGEPQFPIYSIPYPQPAYTPLLISSDMLTATLGQNFMLFVRDGGRSLWYIGYIEGINDEDEDVNIPTDITSEIPLGAGETIQQVVYLGDNVAMVLTSTGRVFTYGYSWEGLLGIAEGVTESFHFTEITANLVSSGAYVSGVVVGGVPATAYELMSEHVLAIIVPPGTQRGAVDITVEGSAPQTFIDAYEYVDSVCAR
jgi:alpha-tubulin suppressor-like RCC1 family protein